MCLMYLTQGLHRSLQRHPAKVALRHVAGDTQREYTFERLLSDIARHAAALQALGVRAGDRVALLSPNNDALIVQLFACWWLGAVACPLNVRWSDGAYGSVVWMLMGLHTFNLVTDVIDTMVLAAVMYKTPLEGKRYVDVAENSGYWVFIVVTWVPIYAVVYWGARF